MKRLILSILLIATLTLSGLALLPTDPAAQAQSDQTLARIDQAMAHLSGYLGITITRRSHYWMWAELIYQDTGLGCPAPGETYEPGSGRGYRIRIEVDDVEYDYRATPSGDVLVLCGPDGLPIYRSDSPALGQPPQQGGASSYQFTPAAFYAWAYLDGNDLMYLISPNGLQATMKRPNLPNETSGPTGIVISPNGAYMLIAAETATGQQVGFFSFAAGDFIAFAQAQPGEEIGFGWGPSEFPGDGSSLVFSPNSARVAVTFQKGSTPTIEWRTVVFDTATGAIVSQIHGVDVAFLLSGANFAQGHPGWTQVLQTPGAFFPRPVYFDNNGGLHTQLILASAGGSNQYPAFVWYPDSNTGALSPYTYSTIDVLPQTGVALFTWQDPGATALPPVGPFESHNAIAQAFPGGFQLAPQNVYRNSNFFFSSGQWADNGAKVVFELWDGVNNPFPAMYTIGSGQQFPLMLPDTYREERGVAGGLLAFDSNTFALYWVQDANNNQTIWNAPPQTGTPYLIWVQPASTSLTIQSIDLTIWGQGGGSPGGVSPPGGVAQCPGTPISQVAVGDQARVSFTDGTPLRLRDAPGGTWVRDMAEGTQFTIIGGPQCQGNYTWWQVQLSDGQTGWSAEGDSGGYFMEPYTGGGPGAGAPGDVAPPGGINPAVGTFQTTFQATELANLAFGVTLGGQEVCKFHNISLSQADVGKTLSASLTNWDIVYPDYYTALPLSVTLYRSYVGPWSAEQSIDLFNQPNAEVVVNTQGQLSFSWPVSQAGDYVVCLQSPVNSFFDTATSFNWAQYQVLLSG